MDPDITWFEGEGGKNGRVHAKRCVPCMKSEEGKLCRHKHRHRLETPTLEEATPYPVIDIIPYTLSQTHVANGVLSFAACWGKRLLYFEVLQTRGISFETCARIVELGNERGAEIMERTKNDQSFYEKRSK